MLGILGISQMIQRGLANSLKNKWDAKSDDEPSSDSAHEETEEDGTPAMAKEESRYLEGFMLQEVVDNYRETIKDPK